MHNNKKQSEHMQARERKPRLLPTIAIYCSVALVTILTIGLIVARSLSDITALATDTRDNILPTILNQQRTSINLERLSRFAETVHRSDNYKIRRQFTLAARILSQDSIFEEDNSINRKVVNAYNAIEEISHLRDKQELINKRNIKLILKFESGNENSKAMLSLKNGKKMLRLIHMANETKKLEDIPVLKNEFSALETESLSPTVQKAINDAQTFFTQRIESLATRKKSTNIWQKVNASLQQMSDNLSQNAAITADDRFTTIAQKAAQAMHTAILVAASLMLALLFLMYLTNRDILVPIIQYVRGLDRIGQEEKKLDLPEARLMELDDIRMAVERSAILMSELADRTEALEIANKTLEREIEEREKIQKELALAKERAENADRAKGDFLAGMSHEIRTPMNTILGMADLMLEANPTAQQHQYIKIFQSSGEMLLSIINDVLDISKIEAGEIGLQRAVIDLDDFIGRTREVVAGRAIQKGLAFIIDVANDVPKQFIGDHVHLRQVLVNLIDNGVKFTEEGEVRLVIHRAMDGGPGAITFTVIDSGIGIPEDVQEQVFHRFTQADASTTRKYGGTGLGLSICRRLVELMGGTIQLESAPHQGSAFSFTLDFELPTTKHDTTKQSPNGIENLIQILSGTPLNILIAEDSDSNQALIELYFKKTTCCLTFASDGQEALEKFKESSYDLVLMDIQMPLMDGLESTRRIRAFETAQGMHPAPIVAVTANAFKEDQQRCFEAGCTDYLSKPISKAGLLQCVARLVKK